MTARQCEGVVKGADEAKPTADYLQEMAAIVPVDCGVSHGFAACRKPNLRSQAMGEVLHVRAGVHHRHRSLSHAGMTIWLTLLA